MARTGRPKIQIDWQAVDRALALQCTLDEVCFLTGLDDRTLERACKREHGSTYDEYARLKRGAGKASLRRRQWHKAIEEGDTTMLIFLGKQYLDQSDRRREEISGPGGTPERIIVEYVNTPPEDTEPAHSADES